ncbi:hypothetical protein FOC1_g10004066 [Fusarium oxysporum f. sp. cubense race 1]|uniref:Uncharacterized protein n=1 Tax=Fusarium oxysporum f. sp. cubense (strain race 1) TaxID=1229664 RepID=N4U9G1_FUSC1|nr:hypothetical protein FOC1_g10004066 [Fusarium oxysporum f. sp. cubense race 1]
MPCSQKMVSSCHRPDTYLCPARFQSECSGYRCCCLVQQMNCGRLRRLMEVQIYSGYRRL